MLVELLSGVLLGLSLAAPPGPVSALMADATLRRGWWAGALVGLGAMTADLGYFLAAWAGAVAVLAAHPVALAAASLAGAGILAFYAYSAWRGAGAADEVRRLEPATFRTGFVVAATSPFTLAWWIGPGTALVASLGVLLGVGMFSGIAAWCFAFAGALGWLGGCVRAARRVVAWASAAVLLAFAVWVGVRGVQVLTASFYPDGA